MPSIVRLGDVCTGHGCWPSRQNVSASMDIFVNTRGVHRVGDSWAIHCCGPSCHAGSQASGSPDTFANSRAVARIGDSISCGSSNATGSMDSFDN